MQFSGLLKKDFLLWRRNILASVCELIFPFLFTLALIGLNTLVETTDITTDDNLPFVLPTNDPLISLTDFEIDKIPLFKDCSTENRKGGRVAIIPDTTFTQKLKPLFDKLNYETVFFDSRDDTENLIASSDYTEPFANDTWKQFCFSVEFDSTDSQQYEYTIRFNVTGPWPGKDHWDTIEGKPNVSFVKDDVTSLYKAKFGGIFLLKNYIDNQIFQEETNKSLTVGVGRFKVDPYTTSTIYDTLTTVVSILTVSYTHLTLPTTPYV